MVLGWWTLGMALEKKDIKSKKKEMRVRRKG